jgi:hypothetical protein
VKRIFVQGYLEIASCQGWMIVRETRSNEVVAGRDAFAVATKGPTTLAELFCLE